MQTVTHPISLFSALKQGFDTHEQIATLCFTLGCALRAIIFSCTLLIGATHSGSTPSATNYRIVENFGEWAKQRIGKKTLANK